MIWKKLEQRNEDVSGYHHSMHVTPRHIEAVGHVHPHQVLSLAAILTKRPDLTWTTTGAKEYIILQVFVFVGVLESQWPQLMISHGWSPITQVSPISPHPALPIFPQGSIYSLLSKFLWSGIPTSNTTNHPLCNLRDLFLKATSIIVERFYYMWHLGPQCVLVCVLGEPSQECGHSPINKFITKYSQLSCSHLSNDRSWFRILGGKKSNNLETE